MGISSGIMSALRSIPLQQKRALPALPAPGQPPVEQPEFDVRTGQPFQPLSDNRSGVLIPNSDALPPDDSPVSGDKENAVLRDMGTMQGTGLAVTSSSPDHSVSSSTPSNITPPANRGDDNDILTHIPKIQMPELSAMPESAHIGRLQAELDAARHPVQPHGWDRVADVAMKLAPTVLGGVLGGWRGAGAGAAGTAEGLETQHKHDVEGQNQLLKQIEEEQSARNARYQAAGHVATTNAQLESNAVLRDAMLRNQSGIAQANRESRESIAGDKLDRQKTVDQSQAELRKAQADLAVARKSAIPAQIKMAEARLDAIQKFADAAQRRAQVMEDSYERDTFGTQSGQPIPGMPTVPDSSGTPHVVGTKPYAASGPTGTTKTKMDQVDAITSVGKTLLAEIDKNKDALGPFVGRWKNLEEMWGNLPPEAARIAGLQESFASLQPALHQFRSTSAKRDFERRLQIGSFKTNADAMKAGVQAAMDSAMEMKSAWAVGRGTGVPAGSGTAKPRSASSPFAPPPADQKVEQWVRDPKTGKLVRQ